MAKDIEIKNKIIIDAGIANIFIRIFNDEKITDLLIPNNDEVIKLFQKNNVLNLLEDVNTKLYVTGKLANIVKETLGKGEIILSSAALWSEARFLFNKEENKDYNTLGIIDLSASGYLLTAINKEGELINDLLVTNPRCGAGSGINISRILQKLNIKNEEVDKVLEEYLGEAGKEKRKQIQIRADRCGVFSSSATISDKNQGVPLANALAITMKSEVIKVCRRMEEKVDVVYLCGRVFDWKFMRDCANDFLLQIGIKKIIFLNEQDALINGVLHLINTIGAENFRAQLKNKLSKKEIFIEYPSFKSLKAKYEKTNLFKRIPDSDIENVFGSELENTPVNIGLDIGSTMAKIIIAKAENNKIIFKGSYNNHGDTIETVKQIFFDIKKKGANSLNIQNIGITGSGRYQVQNILQKIYQETGVNIFVLVENYAHARGSINYAKNHIEYLKNIYPNVNKEFCVLVDIGGEDTKVSTISLQKEELFDNAMNIKCSAGTGSLMDTLKALFDIENISDACTQSFNADKAYEINATCAVFLMENAKKMQSLGYKKDEILASCNYAIIENMARTLWNQIEFPKNAVVLLHGQTMLSDPLPLAATKRLLDDGEMYSLVPPFPGHRACIGLIDSVQDKGIVDRKCLLDDFLKIQFDKKIINCFGAVCGDKDACCARTLLTSTTTENKISVLLGGCAAINEISFNKKDESDIKDVYGDIWKYIDKKLPKSLSKNRLVIPRSFAVSEQAYFLSQIFENLGIPVYVDNVVENDILNAQSLFNIDVCAPLIGAVGQYIRLSGEDHGVILAPQIDFLPTNEKSLGRTCTTNQGGIAVAERFAKNKNPNSNIILFDLSIKKLDPDYLANQLFRKLQKVFKFYNIKISQNILSHAIRKAIESDRKLKDEIAEIVSGAFEMAINEKYGITVVCGREYILNPGIYDSHIGKLIKDKRSIAIPAYAIEVELDSDFNYIYWRNPHDLVSKINAIANNKLSKIIKNKRLKSIVQKIEKDTENRLISLVQVSTFRCGPDAVISPVIAEITKKIPSLFIQSDAMIKELAHLENRVNTYINQLNKKLHQIYEGKNFEISIIDDFDAKKINKETDIIYFPTLQDNRLITNVFRGAGITVIDNFEDDSFDLEQKVRLGRKYAGDSVCAPLAAVFADILLAEENFIKRKKFNEEIVKGKTRILVFDNKGTGPCRQGQYFEMHKLLLNKKNDCVLCGTNIDKTVDYQVKLLVGHEKENYDVGVPEWVLIQSFQGFILQGILHSILLKFGANCKDQEQYKAFYKEYLDLKNHIFHILENNLKPSDRSLKISDRLGKVSIFFSIIYKYFIYGLYNNNGIRTELNNFTKRWEKKQTKNQNSRLNIFLDGEAYIKGAQAEDVFNGLVDAVGFSSFNVDYSPLWLYLELILNYRMIEITEKNNFEKIISNKIKNKISIFKINFITIIIRKVLAKPLYASANIIIPSEIKKVLKEAKIILTTIKPQGELPAYLGEMIIKAKEGVDLCINLAPEGCMVSSMGQLFSDHIIKHGTKKTRIEDLFTLNGEVNHEQLQMMLLKTIGPEKYYKK